RSLMLSVPFTLVCVPSPLTSRRDSVALCSACGGATWGLPLLTSVLLPLPQPVIPQMPALIASTPINLTQFMMHSCSISDSPVRPAPGGSPPPAAAHPGGSATG